MLNKQQLNCNIILGMTTGPYTHITAIRLKQQTQWSATFKIRKIYLHKIGQSAIISTVQSQ